MRQFQNIKSTILIIISSWFFFSCDSPKEMTSEHTYFGGEIINPNVNYIVISKLNSKLDTVYFDTKNRFFTKISDLTEGLYSLKHNPEYQTVILEKGDSLFIRINTLEFDESLVYTGKGSRKNNFLIDQFLINEKEREQLHKTGFRLLPDEFKKQQDSLLQIRFKSYNKLIKKYSLSDLAQKITKASFIYDFYARHEMYFYQHYGITNIDSITDLPESFFDYRQEVDFNDDDLKRLYSYNRFLNHHITNSSYTNFAKGQSYLRNPVGNTLYELNLIDSLIQHPYIKNNILKGTTKKFLLDSEDDNASNKILEHYLSMSSEKRFQKELKKLIITTSRLKPNNSMPEQNLVTSNQETVELSSLYKKPLTAIFFWSMESKDHNAKAHKRAAYLEQLYPETHFISINTDNNQFNNWLKIVKKHGYNLDKEFQFKFPKQSSEELIIHYKEKVFLVNQEGQIIKANSNLFSPSFEKDLMTYSKIENTKK